MSTCYVLLSAVLLSDIAGNTLTSHAQPHDIGKCKPQCAALHLRCDGALFVSFGLDMEARALTLRFDEPVSSVSLRATALTVVRANNSKRTVLAGGSTVSADGSVIVGDLLTTDINEIEGKDYGLALNDIFLALTSGAISDMGIAPNPVVAVSVASAHGCYILRASQTPRSPACWPLLST